MLTCLVLSRLVPSCLVLSCTRMHEDAAEQHFVSGTLRDASADHVLIVCCAICCTICYAIYCAALYAVLRYMLRYMLCVCVFILFPELCRCACLSSRCATPTRRCSSSRPRSVRKTYLLRHFILKTIVLPRQARDKHRESTQKFAFFADGLLTANIPTKPPREVQKRSKPTPNSGAKCAFCAPFYTNFTNFY
eukprot:COSAG06_NODE_167_length_21546_cov_35.001352_10_plen_192_part_00